MRKIISLLLIMSFLFIGFAIPAAAVPGEQNGDSLSIVNANGGAYVIITGIEDGILSFNYGWNNSKAFEAAPIAYWIGVYDVSESHYVWVDEILIEPGLKMLKLTSEGTQLISGDDYYVNFFVRSQYGPTVNVAEITVSFTAP